MHCTATIKNYPSGQYSVTYGPRSSHTKTSDDFETAYKSACDWVGWDTSYLKIDILPDNLRHVIATIHADRDGEVLEAKVGATYNEYLKAKSAHEASKAK